MSLFFSLSPAVLSFLPHSPKSKPWLLILTPLQSYMGFLLSSPLIPIMLHWNFKDSILLSMSSTSTNKEL